MPFFIFPSFYSKKWPKRDVANLPRLFASVSVPLTSKSARDCSRSEILRKKAWDCNFGPFLLLPRPQSLTFPLWESKIDSHGGNVKVGGLWWEKVSETAEMLNMLNFLGFLELMGCGRGGPKSLTCLTFPQQEAFFCRFNPQSLTFPQREANFCENLLPTGEMLNLVSFGGKKVSETAEMLTC